jgi:hypothetical protein
VALGHDCEDRRADDGADLVVDAVGGVRRLDAVGELRDEAELERVDALRRVGPVQRGSLEVVLGEHPELVAGAQRDRPAGAVLGRADDVLDDALAKRRPCSVRLPDDADDFAFAEPGPDTRSVTSRA